MTLPNTVLLPFDYQTITSGDPGRLADYMRKLVNTITEHLEAIVREVNLPGNADTVDGFHASQTPAASTIPASDSSGYINDWVAQGAGSLLNADKVDGFNASQTPTANCCSVATSAGVLNNGWLSDSIRGYEHPVNPVAYYNAHDSTNYPISVGEVCKVTFSSAQTVPLRIATGNGQIFDMGIYTSNTGGTSGGGSGHIYLEPNDTSYTNGFVYNEYQRSTSTASNDSETNDHFRLGYAFGSSRCELINFTGYKCAKGMYDIYGIDDSWPFLCIFDTVWQDTSTSWSSLGTMHFAQNSTGFILIRRLA